MFWLVLSYIIWLCPLVWLICSLKTQIFNLPRVVKFLASNLRQFQAGKINFTVKSAKFKQNLTNKLCCFLCLVLLFLRLCWLAGWLFLCAIWSKFVYDFFAQIFIFYFVTFLFLLVRFASNLPYVYAFLCVNIKFIATSSLSIF